MTTVRLPPMPSVREVIKLYNLRSRKHLSQNFLLDKNICTKIVRCGGSVKNGKVVEIGPGPGSITRAILEQGVKELVVIEKDPRFIPGLQLLADTSNMRIFQGDILQFNMDKLFSLEDKREWDDNAPNIHIIGNLPFNVSTPLLTRLLDKMASKSDAWSYGRTKMTLTFQKEVAERITAKISSKQRSRLSIMCQNYCKVNHAFTIPGRMFMPAPEVDVGVVHFEPLKEPQIKLPFKLIEKVVRHTFQFRQKKCKRGLQTLFPPDRHDLLVALFKMTDIDPATRPYSLDITEFDKFCTVYNYLCEQEPGLIDYDFRSGENAKIWREHRPSLDLGELDMPRKM